MELDVLRSVLTMLSRGERVAMATVIGTRGSAPRRAGSKMGVSESGRIVGTVGGGCGEAEVVRAAVETLRDGQRRRVLVDLTEDLFDGDRVTESPAVCGGTMDVFIELVDPESEGVDAR